MTIFEAEKFVTCSLVKLGALCRTESGESGQNNIIVSWRSTVWRIMVRTINKENSSLWPLDDEIKLFKQNAALNNQTFVIAFVHSNNTIEYRSVEDGSLIHPRCIIRVRRANMLIDA
jgi:hypothetical protein